MCNRPTEKQHSFNHPAQLQQLAAAARRPEKRDLGNKVTKKGQKCSCQGRRTARSTRGWQCWCPARLMGAMAGSVEQSCFRPPPITDSSAPELPSSAGKPPAEMHPPHGWWKLLQILRLALVGRQRPQPSPPVAGPRHRPPARCRSRGSQLVNSPAWCGGKAAMRRGYSPKVVLF